MNIVQTPMFALRFLDGMSKERIFVVLEVQTIWLGL